MIELPWTSRTTPHFVLEINRKCNMTCTGCYKRLDGSHRTLREIREDLRVARRLRQIHTVSIAGAEPSLHPDLCRIVRMVRRQGFRAALITNGLGLRGRLADLKRAGLDIVMLHIDQGQRRPDLPASPAREDIRALRKRLAAEVVAHDIDAGLIVTLFPDCERQLSDLVRFVLNSQDVHFLFATQFFDFHADAGDEPAGGLRRGPDIAETLEQAFALKPFACIRRQATGNEANWLTYFAPVVIASGGEYGSATAGELIVNLTGGGFLYFPGAASAGFDVDLEAVADALAGSGLERVGSGQDSQFAVRDGWSGTFTNGDGDTVTVTDGVITDVSSP